MANKKLSNRELRRKVAEQQELLAQYHYEWVRVLEKCHGLFGKEGKYPDALKVGDHVVLDGLTWLEGQMETLEVQTHTEDNHPK